MASGLTHYQLLEWQIRQATDRLILVSPDEQPDYLRQLAKLASELIKEKRVKEAADSEKGCNAFH